VQWVYTDMSLLQIHEPNESPDPHARDIAIGIDLGTTNSVVAYVRDGKPIALEDASGASIIPSALHFSGGETQVGRAAFECARAHHAHPMQSIKRLMGKSAAEARDALPQWREAMADSPSGTPTFLLDGKEHTPVTLSADILRHLRDVAERALGVRIMKAVITVPAYFDDAARHATRQAAALAGLEVLRLINEPTAAAMAYGLEHGSEGIYAIYDLGGGTFDVSILRLERGVFQVLATAGDTALGGDDVDAALAHVLIQQAKDILPYGDALLTARALKEMLSVQTEASLEYEGETFICTADALYSLCDPFMQRTTAICTQALQDAGMMVADLDGVVLVGGSTRLRALREAVAAFFTCPIYSDLDPDRVVAYGAAIQADALTHGSDHLLLDVTPLSLGLETMGGIAEKVIYRNTPIPASAAQEFTTYADGQTGMQIHVVQGERELVDQCRSLARFELAGIPPMPAGIARVEVRFTIDADGLLMVSAEEKGTGVKQTVQVKPSYGLPIEEIEVMIRAGMEHGKEDMLARMLIEARVEAARTLEELRSALHMDAGLLDADGFAVLATAMQELSDAIADAPRDALHQAHEAVKAASGTFAEARMNQAITKALTGKRAADVGG
jgi:molecular chaperone HscA